MDTRGCVGFAFQPLGGPGKTCPGDGAGADRLAGRTVADKTVTIERNV